MKSKVFFRNSNNRTLFILNASQMMQTVPVVDDFIHFRNGDFSFASFRMKPYRFEKIKSIRHAIECVFVVVSRKYDIRFNEWELLCEPTSKSLLYLLKQVKTK